MSTVADIVHRLRNREHAARAARQFVLADDLRMAIAELERLERDLLFGRRPTTGDDAPPRGREPIRRGGA
jgi:hypothetical protein